MRAGRVLAGAAAAVFATAAAAAELRRGDEAMALTLRTDGSVDDGASFSGSADITAAVGALDADLGASLQTGRSLGAAEGPLPFAAASSWRATGLSLDSRWTFAGVDLSFTARQATRRFASSTETLSPQPLLTAFSDNAARSAALAVRFRPADALDVRLGAETARTSVGDRTDGTAAANRIAAAGTLFSTLTWRASSAVALEAGASIARTAVRVDSAAGGQGSSTVRPRVAATLAAGDGTRLRLIAERVVEPLQPWFVTAVAPYRARYDIALRPESEWRLEAQLDGKLSPMLTFTTGLTVADRAQGLETAADGYGGQALTQAGAGTRREVNVALAADLARVGLDGATLTGTGAWRNSSVDDLLTNSPRRVSGERPYEGRIVFAQALPVAAARWGVDGYVSGPTELFGFTDNTRVDPAAGLGGFVEYNPGTVRLKLRADNLVGRARVSQTSFYAGVGETAPVSRFERRVDRGPSVTLSLTGKL